MPLDLIATTAFGLESVAAREIEQLGYEPKVKLEEGLEQMVDWIKARGPRPFRYHLDLEIVGESTPPTWRDRLM